MRAKNSLMGQKIIVGGPFQRNLPNFLSLKLVSYWMGGDHHVAHKPTVRKILSQSVTIL